MIKYSTIVYFCPSLNSNTGEEEINSIESVQKVLFENSDVVINISPNWADLMIRLQNLEEKDILVVFRLDFLYRKNMMLDEVLSMLDSLTKFVADKKSINIAVVVPKPCDSELILKLKRNNVLGIIPGLRFFDKKHSIEAYQTLRMGFPHWPAIAIENKAGEFKSIELTKRQYEIFNLVARRGLSNKKIADTLRISEDTVKTHVGTILKRYGVKNRTQLALANDTGVIK